MESTQSQFNFGFIPTQASKRTGTPSNVYVSPLSMVNTISEKGEATQEIRVSKAFMKEWGMENNSINYGLLNDEVYIIVLPENDGISLKRTNKGKLVNGLNTKSTNFKAPYLTHIMYQAGLLPEADEVSVEDANLSTYTWLEKVKVPFVAEQVLNEDGSPAQYGNSVYLLKLVPDTYVAPAKEEDEEEEEEGYETQE
jgi:hypothetical protein